MVVDLAAQLAEEVLFPAALATDRAERVPRELLDALDRFVDVEDFPTVCRVVEELASGCLATTFVWLQHLGVVHAARSSALGPRLAAGELHGGLALGGALPGPALLTAREVDGGWSLTGTSPFVSGWGLVDVVHTAARTDDRRLVWTLVDAAESETLSVERLELVVLNATATVRAEFRDHVVPSARMTSIAPYVEGPTPPEVLRLHAALALGVVRRCGWLREAEPVRAELDRLDPATIEAARAAAGELALRAAAAFAVETGSKSLLMSERAQLLVREALFCLTYALRPGSRAALLASLSKNG